MNYNQPIQDWGSVGVTLVGTYLNSFETTPIPGGGSYDCAGLYGPTCGTPLPEWRSKLRGTWNTPWNVNLALTWRYFSSVDIDTSSDQAALKGAVQRARPASGLAELHRPGGGVEHRQELDAVRRRATTSSTRTRRSSAPLIAGPPFGNGNTYPQVYDSLGRNLFLSITGKY